MSRRINVPVALKRLFKIDPLLENFKDDIQMRLERYNNTLKILTGNKQLSDFADGYLYFGFHRTSDGWVFREWLPGADAVWLFGDFNGWEKFSHPLTNIGQGVWEITLEGKDALCHGQFVKLMVGRHGKCFERIPAYIRRTELDTSDNRLCGQIWCPDEEFSWSEFCPEKDALSNPLIYEAHVGMAQEYGGIGSYREFADNNLLWIKNLGYNAIQLMAIQEHPYYASFGYQVTNFFAPAHRSGTPEDLKYLINKAHEMEISVILDVVHSHACPNLTEGLNMQDGTEDQYFHFGDRGNHIAWETKCFDYGKHEVLHFLLSNLKFWLSEYHFDGFRFDGVTSMLYENHGLGEAFTNYSMYYSLNTNVDACIYLMLANKLTHEVNPNAITIAEDMSGMPGMCLGLESAGLGFDMRLGMGIPDMWIKLIKEQKIEDWDVFYLWHELTGSRPLEGSISYAESHDQALVGDKTIMFRLADAEMYTGMMKDYHTPSMDTAIDMHKLIRFLTLATSKSGYLNFMGNEFGHPEWIDFPREGNGWSYHYARRQWSLAKNCEYKYEWLLNFDREMLCFVNENKLLCQTPQSIWLDNQNKYLIFSRGDLIFAFNLHPTNSLESVYVDASRFGEGEYKVVFSSDKMNFGGQDRVSTDHVYSAVKGENGVGFSLYLPCRTAVVIKRII